MKSKLPLLLIGASLALSAHAVTFVPSYDESPGIAFDNLSSSTVTFEVDFVVDAPEPTGATICFGNLAEPEALEIQAPSHVIDFTVEREASGLEYAVMIVKAPEPDPLVFDFDRAMKATVPRQPLGVQIAEPSTLAFASLGILPFLRRHR